jgi:HSP20 family protein
MSFLDDDFEKWFRRFMGRSRFGHPSLFRDIDDIQGEMEKMFEAQFRKLPSDIPKELIREYETPEGGKMREIGPIIYGYSVTIGPDGKPKMREFGNVKPFGVTGPQLTAEREPLVDVITTETETRVVVELPGVDKQNIKINAHDHSVEISADTPTRKYHRVVDIPSDADVDNSRSTYKNGILEVFFKRKTPPKGRQINIE